MNFLKISLGLSLLIFLSFSTVSCAENKKSEETIPDTQMMQAGDGHQHEHNASMNMNEASEKKVITGDQDSSKSKELVAGYIQLKNALVADNSKEAAAAAGKMVKAFKAFDTSGFNAEQQKELAEIIENASEQAEHIVKNAKDIEHQREHLEVLSNDMVDLLAITGTETTLYQTRCPMFNKGEGGIWLSETKEIRNPFYGSKMLTCGSIQKEI